VAPALDLLIGNLTDLLGLHVGQADVTPRTAELAVTVLDVRLDMSLWLKPTRCHALSLAKLRVAARRLQPERHIQPDIQDRHRQFGGARDRQFAENRSDCRSAGRARAPPGSAPHRRSRSALTGPGPAPDGQRRAMRRSHAGRLIGKRLQGRAGQSALSEVKARRRCRRPCRRCRRRGRHIQCIFRGGRTRHRDHPWRA
jgi:hypothetical protein